MTTQKLFKRRVRERMSKTGESYTSARRHVAKGREPAEQSRARLASARELASDERLSQATGRDWQAWLAELDQLSAGQDEGAEIVDRLINEYEVPHWWAMTIRVGYERARGMRQKHQQPDGFTIYASKTVGVPLDVLFDAFVDETTRERWLGDRSMSARSAQPGKVARFDWVDGRSRVQVSFEEKGPAKSTAHVAHERLADADAAEAAKAFWRKRLPELKSLLESSFPTD